MDRSGLYYTFVSRLVVLINGAGGGLAAFRFEENYP